jgi:hypothetical protein
MMRQHVSRYNESWVICVPQRTAGYWYASTCTQAGYAKLELRATLGPIERMYVIYSIHPMELYL